MRWLVEAADARTGADTAITVEALTEAEAERLARYNGLLVSRISKASGAQPAPVVSYASVGDGHASIASSVRLVRRARSTERLGVALWFLGWTALILSVGSFSYSALRHGWGDLTDWRAWLPAALSPPAWRLALGGVAAVVVGSVLRLLAAMALALGVAGRRGRLRAEARPVPGSPAKSSD